MKRTACCLVALATVMVSAQVLTPEQTLDRRSIGERAGLGLSFSPDGSRVAFSVADPVKGAARARAIWLYELASGKTRQITFSGKNDSSPQWSPDGESIAFLSDRDGAAQIYRLSMRGGEGEKLTDRKDEIRAFRQSPEYAEIEPTLAGRIFAGDAASVAAQLDELGDAAQADELVLVAPTPDLEAKLTSLEVLAKEFGLTAN